MDTPSEFVEISEVESVFQSLEELEANDIRDMQKYKDWNSTQRLGQQGLEQL